MCLGFVKNYAGFMVVRAVLGVTEGGLLPGIVRRSQHETESSTDLYARFCIYLECIQGQRWLSGLDFSTRLLP
jgi:hypothetical protein